MWCPPIIALPKLLPRALLRLPESVPELKHFNAGFCLGRLLGADLATNRKLGVAASGYYVREAESPTLRQLAKFMAASGIPPGFDVTVGILYEKDKAATYLKVMQGAATKGNK